MHFQSNSAFWEHIAVTKQPSAYAWERVLVAVVVCLEVNYNWSPTIQTCCNQPTTLTLVGLYRGATMRYHTPKAAAALLDISVSSLRNYCATYKAFLSADASPAPGTERKLSDHDIAVLQRIRELRATGLDTAAIVEALQTEDTTTLQPYIDAATQPEPLQPPTVATMPSDVLQAIQTIADDRYDALQRRIETMEAQRGDNLQWFALGLVAGVILLGVVAAIVLAGAWLSR